jgi:hypothetical protein
MKRNLKLKTVLIRETLSPRSIYARACAARVLTDVKKRKTRRS